MLKSETVESNVGDTGADGTTDAPEGHEDCSVLLPSFIRVATEKGSPTKTVASLRDLLGRKVEFYYGDKIDVDELIYWAQRADEDAIAELALKYLTRWDTDHLSFTIGGEFDGREIDLEVTIKSKVGVPAPPRRRRRRA